MDAHGGSKGAAMTLAAHGARAHTKPLYLVTDRLHAGRAVEVPGDEIAEVVSGWLAELGAHSPLAADLERAACVGDWAAARAVGDQMSVDVAGLKPNWHKVLLARAVVLS
jgi:hypothetical protein